MFLKIRHLGKNDWWRYLLTLLSVGVAVVIGQIPLLAIITWLGHKQGKTVAEMNEMSSTLDFSPLGIDQNLTVFFFLLPFAVGILGLWFGVKIINQRAFRTLITPLEKINWRKILFSFTLWMLLAMLAEFVSYLLTPSIYSFQFQPGKFVVLLLISLLILPLQTSFEELLFRGYLLPGIGLLSKYRWIPWVITSVAFGSLHFMNPEVQEFGLGISMAYYIGIGLFLGFITLMDDSLELALGVHAATNIFSALFVTFDDSALQTAALFHTSEVNMSLMLGCLAASAAFFTWVVSKKYGWQDWTKWYGQTEKPHFGQV